MKLKDRKFDLFGTEYTIEYVNKIETVSEDVFTSGCTNPAAHTIKIAKKDYNGNEVNPNEHKITLLHELLHAILDGGQYRQESNDEPMVEWIARCLKSLMDQKVI